MLVKLSACFMSVLHSSCAPLRHVQCKIPSYPWTPHFLPAIWQPNVRASCRLPPAEKREELAWVISTTYNNPLLLCVSESDLHPYRLKGNRSQKHWTYLLLQVCLQASQAECIWMDDYTIGTHGIRSFFCPGTNEGSSRHTSKLI